MTQRMEHLDPVMEELERYGLKGEIGERGKHLEVRWKTPSGERFITVPKTPSDWRGALNSRSDLRKLLRADNLQPKQISELTFQKAMSLPKPAPISREQFLQNDVNELTDIVFELQNEMNSMRSQMAVYEDKLRSIKVVSHIQFGDELITPEIAVSVNFVKPEPFRYGTKSAAVYAVLTDQFKHMEDIVRESGIAKKYCATILWKSTMQGYSEKGLRQQWRRKS